jgi:choline dehydrogenase
MQTARDTALTMLISNPRSAGAYGTPQLLLLSGIGPAAELQRFGISVVQDSPEVGKNLQEHPLAPLIFRTRREITLKNADSIGALLNWLLLRRGPLTSNIAEAMAFTNTEGDRAPNFEIIFAPVHWQNEGLTPPSEHACTFGLGLLTPRSRGTVSLKSADSRDPPAIDLGLLSDPEGKDMGVLIAGLRLARQIAAQEPIAGELTDEMAPGADVTSDSDLAAFLRQSSQTIYHPVGTARMGEDKGAVVDSSLRVRGVDGLWIADASVMPKVPRGHPNAVVAMIASRAAEML